MNVWQVIDSQGRVLDVALTERIGRDRARAYGLGDAHVHRVTATETRQSLGAWQIDRVPGYLNG